MVHGLGFKFSTLWFFAKDLQTLLSLRLKFYILLCSAHTAHWKFLWVLPNFVMVRAHLKPEWNSKKLTVWTVYNKASLMLERGNLYFQRICNFGLYTESYQKLLFVQTQCMKNLYFMQSMFLLKSLLFLFLTFLSLRHLFFDTKIWCSWGPCFWCHLLKYHWHYIYACNYKFVI